MGKFTKYLEALLNIARVGLIVYTAVVLISQHRASLPEGAAATMVGSRANLEQVDWAANGRSLIIALQTHCPYCEASADFYRSLLASIADSDVHVIAALPDTLPVAEEYLKSRGLAIQDIRGGTLSRLGVHSTPTLILVGADGRVKHSWVGRLSGGKEKEVFLALGIRAGSFAVDNPKITKAAARSEVREITPAGVRSLHGVPVVDIRDRSDFAIAHLKGSINIPLDELEARAKHEVRSEQTVVIYCDRCAPCEAQSAAHGIATYCRMGATCLEKQGFSDVRILREDLKKIESAGLEVTWAHGQLAE